MNGEGRISLKLLTGDPIEMSELQRVFVEAPDYAMRIMGHPPGPSEAQSTYSILPPEKSCEDKFVLGIIGNGEMIGCVDLIRGYPDERTAMLGLLLLSEKCQRQGFGAVAYQKVEEFIRGWSKVEKVRIGIVRTNDIVIPFWERMGFVDTGQRRPYDYDKLRSEHLIFEKALR